MEGSCLSDWNEDHGHFHPPPGGGELPIMAYTGRLCPKGVPFSGFRYMKG